MSQTAFNVLTIANTIVILWGIFTVLTAKHDSDSLDKFTLNMEKDPNETPESSASKEASQSKGDPKGKTVATAVYKVKAKPQAKETSKTARK